MYQLTDRVWWGSMGSPVAERGHYKSIIDLAGNYSADCHHYRLSQVNEDVAILRLPITEDTPADDRFCQMLGNATKLIEQADLFPLLVHCMAGQCRSPIVAVHVAWTLGGDLDALLAKMRSLRPDLDQKRLFHKSLREWMQNSAISNC